MLRLLSLLLGAYVSTLFARARRGPFRPTWSYNFEATIEFLRRDFADTESWDFARLRQELEGRPSPSSSASRRVQRRVERIGGVDGEWFFPTDRRDGDVIVYFHGGSYIFGSVRTHGDAIARLAVASGLPIYIPTYRLAPEHPYPAALQDALAVMKAMIAARGREHVLVAGDSAGGNLAIRAQLALRDANEQQARAAILWSPWLDLSSSSASASASDSVDFGTKAMLLRQARAFAGSRSLDDPDISPYFAKLEGLAPALIVAGTSERLFDECKQFDENAKRAGVESTLETFIDMPHNPGLFAGYSPEGARCIEVTANYCKAQLRKAHGASA